MLCLVIGVGLLVEGSIEKSKFNKKTKGYESIDGNFYVDNEIIEDVSVISESEKQNISLELEGLVLSNLVGNIKVGTVKITVSRP